MVAPLFTVPARAHSVILICVLGLLESTQAAINKRGRIANLN